MGEVGHAIRRLRASPTFTIAATLTLAIAIGATASVYSMVDGVLFKAFPYRDPSRVLVIFASDPAEHVPRFPLSAADFIDYRAQSTSFAALAAGSYQPVTVSGGPEAERLWSLAVTPNWFAALGLTPALGRFLAADSLGPAEVVISYGYWQRRFGGRPTVLGQTIRIEDQPHTVVGVMPAGYFAPSADELWTRLSFSAAQVGAAGATRMARIGRAKRWVYAYGRLKPTITPDFAQRELQMIAGRLAASYPETDRNWSAVAVPIVEQVEGAIRPALIALLAAAACVLLIGAANLANLFLVRYLAREREIAVRTALGATRIRVLRELLMEALALSLAGGTLGVTLAVVGARALRLLAPATLPRLHQVGVDARVVAFCALALMATVLVFGLLPAWQAAGGSLAPVLKEGGRATGSARRYRLQNVFVVLQVAVALVLLTGAGLLVESFDHFRRMDPGFRGEGVLTAEIDLPAERYTTTDRQALFAHRVVEELEAQPGVEAASISEVVPGLMTGENGFSIVGDPAWKPGEVPIAYAIAVSADYFRTMGIRVLRGRGLLPTDDRRAIDVAVINERLARQFFPNRDPLGHRITWQNLPDTVQIVGVVTSVKQGGLEEPDRPEMYVPFAQFPNTLAFLALRTSGDPASRVRLLRRVVASVDSTAPVSDVATMNERMTASLGTGRFSAFLASLFATIAVVLGMVGIYSVLAFVVSHRQREIAVRIALGASRSHVIGSVLLQAMRLTGIGLALGSGMAWVLTRLLANLFAGVNPHDPTIFISALVVFAFVALTAACIPAVRTTRISPVVALNST